MVNIKLATFNRRVNLGKDLTLLRVSSKVSLATKNRLINNLIRAAMAAHEVVSLGGSDVCSTSALYVLSSGLSDGSRRCAGAIF